MKTIEAVKKEEFKKRTEFLLYLTNGDKSRIFSENEGGEIGFATLFYQNLQDAYLPLIDEAVSIASKEAEERIKNRLRIDMERCETILETNKAQMIILKKLEEAYEAKTKEAVERKRKIALDFRKYVLEELQKIIIKLGDPPQRSYKFKHLINLRMLHICIRMYRLSTPQPEKEGEKENDWTVGAKEKIAELERLHEKEIKEAVEREQKRIIGVIDEIAKKIRDDKARYSMLDFENIRLSDLHDIKSALSTPQQEEGN